MVDLEMPKRRGRPATYANPAERARAWRQRQKELIAQARQPAEPVVIEKVVEKVIEVPIPADFGERLGGARPRRKHLGYSQYCRKILAPTVARSPPSD